VLKVDSSCGDDPSISPDKFISDFSDKEDISGYNNPHALFNSMMSTGLAYFSLSFYPLPENECLSMKISNETDGSNSQVIKLYYRGVCSGCDEACSINDLSGNIFCL
jgi:hypothetical protein